MHEKTGIIGAGAMGSIFAYFFNKAGIPTVLYEKIPSVVEKMSSGLNVVVGGSTERIAVEVSADPSVLRPCDIVFLFVKSHSTRDAAREVKAHLSPTSLVVTLQNGIGNMEALLEFFPEDRVVYGSTFIGANKVDERTVAYGGSVDIAFGGKDRRSCERVLDIFRRAGLSARIDPNPDVTVWKKAIINAAINPLGALLDIPNARILEIEEAKLLQEALAGEAVAVARRRGLDIDFGEMVELTREVCLKTAANISSMLQDIRAGRKTEIDSINGVISRYGRELGVPTPVNDTICSLVRARESA